MKYLGLNLNAAESSGRLLGAAALALLLSACNVGEDDINAIAKAQGEVLNGTETGNSAVLSENQNEVLSQSAERATPDVLSASGLSSDSEQVVELNGCEVTQGQREMLALVNEARSQGRMCGETWMDAAGELEWNCTLMTVARQHSTDMATHNFFSHAGSDGLKVDQRVSSSGYSWRSVGENIAAGQFDEQEVVLDWLDSPGHCTNIMNANYREFGSSLVNTTGSDYLTYWTQVFANPNSR